MIKTVTTTTGVNTVTFPEFFKYFWIKNIGDTTVYASAFANVSAGVDNTSVIKSGDTVCVENIDNDNVYISGEGSVEIHAQNYADCPFKIGGKGGEIPDLSEYAKKTDVPTKVSDLENDSGYLAEHGTIDTARQVTSSSSKVIIYEDNEGGNLRLVSPDGVHYMEMDLYNNEQFRMYFNGGDGMIYPLTYNFTNKKLNINGDADTVDGKHADDFALKTDIPTELPANGGNADTLDGKHADAFVQLADEIILNNIRINANQHKIADINYRWSIWADDEGGNLELKSPDGSRGIQFDCFDNNVFRIYTYVNDKYFGIIEMNHNTGEVTSNGNVISKKPYVTGTLSEQAILNDVTLSFTIFDFTPSKVICQCGSGSAFFANVITNGFSLTIPAGTTTIHYIAFK